MKLKCILVHEDTNMEAKVGDNLRTFRDEPCVLKGWSFPYDPADNLYRGGKIYCQEPGHTYQSQWYPSVCGLKFILVPDVELASV